jgi:hypothetical protein
VSKLGPIVLLCLLVALAAPSGALADGDPASDVLLLQDVYLPYIPAPSKASSSTLTTLLKEVKAKGYPMKVALIQSRGDLGAYPDLFGRAQPYAKLLASEIRFRVHKPHLLVVMPSGFGSLNLGPQAGRLLGAIRIDPGARSDGLVAAALKAVAGIATANGHPTEVPEVRAPASANSGGSSHTLLYVLAGVIVALGIALIAVSVRTRRPA